MGSYPFLKLESSCFDLLQGSLKFGIQLAHAGQLHIARNIVTERMVTKRVHTACPKSAPQSFSLTLLS